MSGLRLVFEKTITPGVFICRGGEHSARVEAWKCNGRGVYGFDEPHPDQVIEQALLRRSDRQVADLIDNARGLGE